jgi:hypothetical protein
MTQPGIDASQEAVFKSFWEGPLPTIDLARHFGVSVVTVHKTAARFGLPPRAHPTQKRRPRPGRLREVGDRSVAAEPDGTSEAELPEVAGGDFWTPARDAAVFRSGGTYRAVGDLAASWGVTTQVVLARWHKLRVA